MRIYLSIYFALFALVILIQPDWWQYHSGGTWSENYYHDFDTRIWWIDWILNPIALVSLCVIWYRRNFE